jgi:hypothetical protein
MPQIHPGPQIRCFYVKRMLFVATGALILIPTIGRADDSVGEKAEEAARAVGQGIEEAARGVKQAIVGHDVEVTLGETHMDMPTRVSAGNTTFKVSNAGTEVRGFKISGPGMERFLTTPLPPGQTEQMTVNLTPGVYQVGFPAQGDPTKHLTVTLTTVEK